MSCEKAEWTSGAWKLVEEMAIEMFAGNTKTIHVVHFEVRDAIWYFAGLGVEGYKHQPRDTVFDIISATTTL
jgi:hypothetical protein